MKIEKIRSNTRSAEAGDLASSIIYALEQSGIKDKFLSGIKTELDEHNELLNRCIKKNKTKSKLDELDARRDNAYRSLLHLCKGYLHHPDARVKQSASIVDKMIKKYGFELVDANYSAESALLESFLKDMAKPELSANIALLPGIKDLTEQLSQEQLRFKKAETALLKARSIEQKLSNATAVKKDLIKIVNDKLVVYLRAMFQLNPKTYETIASHIAMLIDKNNSVAKRRRKH